MFIFDVGVGVGVFGFEKISKRLAVANKLKESTSLLLHVHTSPLFPGVHPDPVGSLLGPPAW